MNNTNTRYDVMGLPIEMGSRVIPASSMYNFSKFRKKKVHWIVVGFTPKMVKIESTDTQAMLEKKTIYANELLNIGVYIKEYPEIML